MTFCSSIFNICEVWIYLAVYDQSRFNKHHSISSYISKKKAGGI